MKISLHLLLITCMATIFAMMPPAKSHLLAVSPLRDSKYYVQVRKKRLKGLTRYSSQPMEEADTIKENICDDILGSVLFETYDLDPIDPRLERKYPDVYESLKQKYPNIYENLYERRPAPVTNSQSTANSYQVYNITTSPKGKYKEYLFTCRARNRYSGEIVEYFVSRKYDVNGYVRIPAHRIEGRFIFMRDERQQMMLIALAEEPAHQSFDLKAIEGIYMEFVNKRVRTKVDKVDPICRLTAGEKVRLCTIIWTAVGYREGIRFLPDESSIEPDCEQNSISFQRKISPQIKKIAGSPREWMIGCKAQLIATRQPFTYYISRGYKANTCYVYRMENGQMVFDHLSLDVAVYVMPRTYMDPA